MKALDLVIYDRNEDGDYLDTPDHGGKRFVIALEDVEVYSMYKQLTDAELAAEHWCEYAESLFWAPERGRVHTQQGKLHRDATERTEILERFATLPHYDEDQP